MISLEFFIVAAIVVCCAIVSALAFGAAGTVEERNTNLCKYEKTAVIDYIYTGPFGMDHIVVDNERYEINRMQYLFDNLKALDGHNVTFLYTTGSTKWIVSVVCDHGVPACTSPVCCPTPVPTPACCQPCCTPRPSAFEIGLADGRNGTWVERPGYDRFEYSYGFNAGYMAGCCRCNCSGVPP